jgi:predicted nucleic acid-binding protein
VIFVFDASFVAALLIPDEKNGLADSLYAGAVRGDIFVPALLWPEMGNLFNNLIRRKRYTYNEVLTLLPGLSAMRLTTDTAAGPDHAETLLRLARDYDLSAYDAAYLELAGRKKARLATLDEKLEAAAERCGIAPLQADAP